MKRVAQYKLSQSPLTQIQVIDVENRKQSPLPAVLPPPPAPRYIVQDLLQLYEWCIYLNDSFLAQVPHTYHPCRILSVYKSNLLIYFKFLPLAVIYLLNLDLIY